VAVLVGARLLVLLTDAEGLFTADPRLDPGAQLVSSVGEAAALEGLAIGGPGTALGSGGMRSKVVAAELAGAAGITTVIASGHAPGVIPAAWRGEAVGTRFEPQPVRHSSFKLWLKFAKPSQGIVTVDAGASRALREGGTSLLPVGIVGVEGAFEAGDAVDVRDERAAVGKGISNYSAAELRQVKGLKSARVRELLPHATEEAVHRDYFVLA
jgi:glutamate 5-kinase